MANPYMRDALVDELEQGVNTTKPIGGKTPLTPAPTNPWDSAESSRNAPRIVTEGDQTYLTEHGNRRALQGQEVADATKYRDDFWAANPTGFQAGVGPQTNAEYDQAPAAKASAGPLGASGATSGRYSGFDTGRAQDPSTSAKDAFLQAATASGSMPSSKEDAESWFNQYIKQALVDQGYQVDWVQGDKAFVRTKENPGGEEIDFLIGAGGDNPQIGWQSNMAGETTSGGASTTGGGPQLNAALTDPNVLANINSQIEALMGAGLSLDDIMGMLNGSTPSPTTTDMGA